MNRYFGKRSKSNPPTSRFYLKSGSGRVNSPGDDSTNVNVNFSLADLISKHPLAAAALAFVALAGPATPNSVERSHISAQTNIATLASITTRALCVDGEAIGTSVNVAIVQEGREMLFGDLRYRLEAIDDTEFAVVGSDELRGRLTFDGDMAGWRLMMLTSESECLEYRFA
jgi:hypothetical protein